MKQAIWTAITVVGLLWSAISIGQAAETVYGTARGEQCFRDTKFGQSPRSAAEICSEALKKDVMSRRDRARTLVNRGINYNSMERYDDALADFAEALEIWPDLPEAYANRGNTKMLKKEFLEAREDYTRALELDVRDANKVLFNRALTYEAQKQYEKAYEDLKASAELDPTWRETRERLAIYRDKFDFVE